MNWEQFSATIKPENCALRNSDHGSIERLLADKGIITEECCKAHEWYPKGALNSEDINGYRYVDMNHSFCGMDRILISEASCCMIVVLLDKQSPVKFCAHISATNDQRHKLWYLMKFDLLSFYKRIDKDINRCQLFLFSSNLYKGQNGSLEQANFMKLFAYVFPSLDMQNLATETYLIEGEGGKTWNPYCAVRIDHIRKRHFLGINLVLS